MPIHTDNPVVDAMTYDSYLKRAKEWRESLMERECSTCHYRKTRRTDGGLECFCNNDLSDNYKNCVYSDDTCEVWEEDDEWVPWDMWD